MRFSQPDLIRSIHQSLRQVSAQPDRVGRKTRLNRAMSAGTEDLHRLPLVDGSDTVTVDITCSAASSTDNSLTWVTVSEASAVDIAAGAARRAISQYQREARRRSAVSPTQARGLVSWPRAQTVKSMTSSSRTSRAVARLRKHLRDSKNWPVIPELRFMWWVMSVATCVGTCFVMSDLNRWVSPSG